jgi:hypothetical protein
MKTKSQVSFKFDGGHNKNLVVGILQRRLKGLKYKIENESRNVYRIYLASTESKEKTFDVCFGIQCFCVYDFSRNL